MSTQRRQATYIPLGRRCACADRSMPTCPSWPTSVGI